MTKSLKFSLVLFFFIPQIVFAEAEKEIEKSFNAYKSALSQGDGEEASKYVTKSTIDYYEGVKSDALRMKKDELKKLSVFDKIIILRIRHEIDKDTLAKWSGKDLFVAGVDRGWIDKNSMKEFSLGEYKVEKNKASVSILKGKILVPYKINFAKEGHWRIDLNSILAGIAPFMDQVIKGTGLTEDQFVVETLNSISKTKLDDKVWEPLVNES